MGGGNDEREQTLNQLLVEMDGMTDNLWNRCYCGYKPSRRIGPCFTS